MQRLLHALDRHWFGPMPEKYLFWLRVAVFGGALLYLLVPLPAGYGFQLRHQFWLAEMDANLYQPIPALKVFMAPLGSWGELRPSPGLLSVVWLLAVLSAAMAMIGLLTRLSMLLCAAAVTTLVGHYYSYQEFHHPEAPFVIALWVLALGPVTRRMSWRDIAAPLRKAVATMRQPDSGEASGVPIIRWPVRVIQWVLALVYLSAAISKLHVGGLEWFNGFTLTYYLMQDSVFHLGGEGVGLWLARYPAVATVLSIGTVLFELTFFFAVLFPRTAWIYVLAGIAIHTGIYILQAAPFFKWMILYVAFAEPIHQTLRSMPPLRWRSARSRQTMSAPMPSAPPALRTDRCS